MSLSLLTREYRLAHSSAGDLALVAGVFVLALTYLEVPFWNALLFGPAITLQAAVGMVVLTRLLKGVPGSLLLLVGPGLILGGALSFASFQLVGRGMFGLLAVLALGVGAVATIVKSTTWQSYSKSRLWTVGQVLGLTALALAWEFPELFPVAVAFFVLGFFTSEISKAPQWLAWIVGVGATIAIAMVPLLRQQYWWLISDDYQILEVQMRHWTKSGVFADWGASNWGRYHWLSHGWGGLLNALGGYPSTFTTLTRVMPFVYCCSLAASLLLVARRMSVSGTTSLVVMVSTWLVVALNPVDWSGTSTGASSSVIAALIATVVIAANLQTRLPQRLIVYLIFLPIVAVTKFPATFVAFFLIIWWECLLLAPWHAKRDAQVAALLGVILGFLTTLLALLSTSHLLNEFRLSTNNSELGQIAEVGPLPAITLLISLKLWLPAVAIVILVFAYRNRTIGSMQVTIRFVLTSMMFLLIGVAFQLVIDAVNSNGHEYFSSPSFLIASIAILVSVSQLPTQHLSPRLVAWVALAVICASIWQSTDLVSSIRQALSAQLQVLQSQYFVLLSYTLSSSVAAVASALLVLAVIAWWMGWPTSRLPFIALLTLVLTSIGDELPNSIRETSRSRTVSEIESVTGSTENRFVGLWLKANTKSSDVVATNSLRGSDCALLSDYSLALWSERDFFVIGPKFFNKHQAQADATVTSEDFANSPNRRTAAALWAAGVRWFVIDTRVTDRRSWEPYAEVVFRKKDLVVLELASPAL